MVEAYKNGELYTSYPINFHYPQNLVELEIQGIVIFEFSLTESCGVRNLNVIETFSDEIRNSIEKDLLQLSSIFKTYKYQNCQKLVFRDTLEYKLY